MLHWLFVGIAKLRARQLLKELGATTLSLLATTGQPVATFKVFGKKFELVVKEQVPEGGIKVSKITVDKKTFVVVLRPL